MPQISPTSFEDSLVDALPLPACICEAPSGLIMRSNAHAVALWGQQPEPETRIHDFLRFIRPDGAPLPPEAFPLAAAIADGVAEADRQAVIDRRGQPSVLVRINILPLNTVGQRRAGLMLFHSPSERRLRRESLLEDRRRTAESLRLERSHSGAGSFGAFLEAGRHATDGLLLGERTFADTVTAAPDCARLRRYAPVPPNPLVPSPTTTRYVPATGALIATSAAAADRFWSRKLPVGL